MAVAITLIIIGALLLATLELWFFWRLGERDTARRRRHAPRSRTLAPGWMADQDAAAVPR